MYTLHEKNMWYMVCIILIRQKHPTEVLCWRQRVPARAAVKYDSTMSRYRDTDLEKTFKVSKQKYFTGVRS